MAEESLDKKGVLRAMGIALVVSLLGIGILGWQYRRLEKERIPALEEKIEETEAKRILDKFMGLRMVGDAEGVMRYLTEGAVQQKEQGEFLLVNDFEDYEILNSEKLGEGKFRFAVELYKAEGMADFIEVIILIKILDKYYIDSAVIAG